MVKKKKKKGSIAEGKKLAIHTDTPKHILQSIDVLNRFLKTIKHKRQQKTLTLGEVNRLLRAMREMAPYIGAMLIAGAHGIESVTEIDGIERLGYVDYFYLREN